MRDTAFVGLVAAVVAGGLLVGWHAETVMAALTTRHPNNKAATAAPRYHFDIDTTAGERSPAQETPRPPRALVFREPAKPCAMPPPRDDAKVVLFGVYEGEAMSTVSVAGMEQETRVVDVEIEPGDTPLYLVLSSFDPVIWRFSGATGRVAKAALATEQRSAAGLPYAGAVGLTTDQVGYATGKGCLGYFYAPGSISGREAVENVRRFTGRTPSIVGGQYAITAVSLPSAKGAKTERGFSGGPPAPKGFDRTVWLEAVRFMPAGLAAIDSTQVVSAQRAEAYDVLPNQIGLAQLVGDGSMRYDGGAFTVVKPIARYPAELTGAHSVTFRLGEGVPRPAGSPGHSCVIGAGQTRGEGPIC